MLMVFLDFDISTKVKNLSVFQLWLILTAYFIVIGSVTLATGESVSDFWAQTNRYFNFNLEKMLQKYSKNVLTLLMIWKWVLPCKNFYLCLDVFLRNVLNLF